MARPKGRTTGDARVKKGCLLIAGLLIVVVVGGVGVVGYRYAQEFGLTEAPEVSHETLAAPETRVRLRLDPNRMQPLILSLLPPDLPIPAWVPIDPRQRLGDLLPREIVLLAGSNYASGQMEVTVFVNERRGGPFLAQVTERAAVLAGLPFVRWTTPGLVAPRRGVLSATGALPIPNGLEARILEHWTHQPPADTVPLQGGHQLELTLDNRNGELFTFMATLMELNGVNWQTVFADPQFKIANDVIVGILHGRATADLVDEDTMQVNIAMKTTPETGGTLPFITGAFLQPEIENFLAAQYGLKLTGTPRYDGATGLVIGDYRVTGFKNLIDSRLRPALGLPAAA